MPLCPTPFDEPLLSGSRDGGIAGSVLTDGETGVISGFVLGTVKFGLVPGVTLGLVSGVTFGLVPGVKFGFGDTRGVVSGGIVLPGFVVALSGLVVLLEVGLWLCGIALCEPIVLGLVDCPALPERACATAQQPHNRSTPVENSNLRFILSPLMWN